MIVAIAGAALLFLGSFNLVMDPFGAFHLISIYRIAQGATGLTSRNGRGEALSRPGWRSVLIGNSRVYMGLDPQNPVFARLKTYNAGLGGASFPELCRTAQMALAQPSLQRLIVAVDLYEFDERQLVMPDMEKSLINPNINRADYRLSTLFGWYATQMSWQTAQRAWNKAPQFDSPLGFFMRGQDLHGNGWRDWVMGGFYGFTIPKEARTNPRWKLSDPLFQNLTALLDEAGSRGVQVDVVQLPMHFIAIERFVADGQLPLYEHWLRSLAAAVDRHNSAHPDQIAKFWDFCQENTYTTEPCPTRQETSTNMQYFWDPFHFKPTLGNLVLQRMIGGATPPAGQGFGVVVSIDNVDAYLTEIKQEARDYAAKNPIVRQVIAEIRQYRATEKHDQ